MGWSRGSARRARRGSLVGVCGFATLLVIGVAAAVGGVCAGARYGLRNDRETYVISR